MPEFRPKRGNSQSLFGAPLPIAGNASSRRLPAPQPNNQAAKAVSTAENCAQQSHRCFSETGQHIVDQTNVQLQKGLFAEIR